MCGELCVVYSLHSSPLPALVAFCFEVNTTSTLRPSQDKQRLPGKPPIVHDTPASARDADLHWDDEWALGQRQWPELVAEKNKSLERNLSEEGQ